MIEMQSKAVQLDPLQDLTCKGVGEYSAGLALANSPGAQVENRHLVQLTDRRTVAALDIISVDLQLWLGVYLGLPGQQEVLVVLFGVGLLRTSLDRDPAMKDRP